MTAREFGELMATIDNLWGGLDEGLEAGYQWLGIHDEDPALCIRVVRDLADSACRRPQDRPFVPKGPEFHAHLTRLKRELANQERIDVLLNDVRRRELTAGDQPPTQEAVQ